MKVVSVFADAIQCNVVLDAKMDVALPIACDKFKDILGALSPSNTLHFITFVVSLLEEEYGLYLKTSEGTHHHHHHSSQC
jgi:hypothetical protein